MNSAYGQTRMFIHPFADCNKILNLKFSRSSFPLMGILTEMVVQTSKQTTHHTKDVSNPAGK